MNEKIQQQFEQAYSEDNGGVPASFIKLQRLGNSYDIPKIARAWYWFKRSREALVIELPDDGIDDCQEAWGDRCKNTFDCGYNFASLRHEQALEAAGLKVAP